jgi:hypothetical protein
LEQRPVPRQVVSVTSTFQSFDELRGQLRGLELELIPLRASTASGRTKAILGENFIFTAGRLETSHRYRGGSHESHILLGMHFSTTGIAHFGSHVGHPGDLSILQPREEHFGSVTGSYQYGALSIAPAELA